MVTMKLKGRNYTVVSYEELCWAAAEILYDDEYNCYVCPANYINIFAEFTTEEVTLAKNVLVAEFGFDTESIDFYVPTIHNVHTLEDYAKNYACAWFPEHAEEYRSTLETAYLEMEKAVRKINAMCAIPDEWYDELPF